MDAEELTLLRESVRGALARHPDGEKALQELGSSDIVADGGAAVGVLFEEQGKALARSSLLDAVVVHSLGLAPTSEIVVVYPAPPSRGAADGASDEATAWTEGDGLRIEGITLSPGRGAELLVATGEGARVGVVAQDALETAPIEGFDPDAGLRRVSGSLSAQSYREVDISSGWTQALSRARLALAAELLGVTREVRDIAIDHVTTREQFGQPLGSFQTVRHRLAEAHVEISAAEAVCALAFAHDTEDDGEILSAAAKAASGRAYETASRHALQLCGAMGLTWEHRLHRYVRRGGVLNALLGDPRRLHAVLGRRLLAGQVLPRFDPLVSAGS